MCSLRFYRFIYQSFAYSIERTTRNVNTCATEIIFCFSFFFSFLLNPGVEVVSICEIEMDILDVPSCRCINKAARCEKKKKKTRKIQINLSSLHVCYVVCLMPWYRQTGKPHRPPLPSWSSVAFMCRGRVAVAEKKDNCK